VIDPDGFRPNVGIVLMHEDGRVFWARRVRRDGWQFPQGGMNTDETPVEAMYRELREETGLLPEHVDVLGATPGWLRYRLPPRAIRRTNGMVCIGQKQVWFLLRLVGDETTTCAGPDRQAGVRPLALGRFLVPDGARG
jgi:putative (di)nucleoside polyphosphate hydrolase